MTPQDPSLLQSSVPAVEDDWHVVRGLAERANRRIIEPRRVLLTGMLAVLAVGVVVGVLLILGPSAIASPC